APFYLPVFKFYRSSSTEDGDGNAQLTTLRIYFFDHAALVLEWSIGDFHCLADLEANLRFDLLLTFAHLRKHVLDFSLTHWNGPILGSSKPDHARRFANEIPSPTDKLTFLIEEVHIDDKISGEKLARRLAFLAALDFRNPLGRDQHFENHVAHFL